MPIVPLKLVTGVNSDYTPTLLQSGITSCNLIRFKDRLPQKLGGWSKFYPFALSGIPRCIHGWADLNATSHLAVGTTTQLVIITSGSLQDITPQTLTSNFAPNFSTVMSSSTVTIIDSNIANVTTFDAIFFNTPISVGGILLQGLYPIIEIVGVDSYQITAATNATSTVNNGGAVPVFTTSSGTSIVSVALTLHGQSVGDPFDFPISTTVGGIAIDGIYTISTVPDANDFTIAGNVQASSSTSASMNGGNAQLVYYISLGPAAVGSGYGLGGYGLGGYGTGTVPSSQTGNEITATDWTLDNWGQDLLANPKGDAIYYWQPNAGFQTAQLIATGPAFNNGIFVAMPEQILVAYGSTSTGQQQDPLTVRWSDSQDFTNWQVTDQTQAGSFRLPTGSLIVGGIQGPQQALLWTDIDVYAMQYLGPPFVFGFNKLSSGCGLIGPHAQSVMQGNVFWMSVGQFFVLSGNGVQQIPCSVWDAVFQNLNAEFQSKVVAAANSQFNEMAWYYPSLNSTGENDSYVKLNVLTGEWDYGTLSRSAWMDQSVLGPAIGTIPTGLIYQHETSPDADGQPLVSTFTTGYFVLTEGQDLAFVDWIIPDMNFGTFNGTQGASIQITINVVNYPNDTPIVYGPFTMTSAITFINTRLRGRQISLTFTSSDIGSWWRLGQIIVRTAKAGRR